MRVALYLRVSTGEQSVERQHVELLAAAERHGWRIVAEFADEGISGAKGRDRRPAFDRLCRAIVRREIDVIAVWSIDRLGRSLKDLVAFLGDIHAAHVDLYCHQQALDTSTPSGRALFGMLSVFAEFERALIIERVRSGIARARELGTKSGRPFGRPRIAATKAEAVRASLLAGNGIRKTARQCSAGVGTVQRIAAELRT